MHDMQNQHHVILFDAMDNEVVVSREAAQAGTQVIVALSSHEWIPRQQPETPGDRLQDAGSNIGATAFAGDVQPNVVKLCLRFGRKAKLAHERGCCPEAKRSMPRRLT